MLVGSHGPRRSELRTPGLGLRLLPRWTSSPQGSLVGGEPQVSATLAQDRHPGPQAKSGRQRWSSLRSGDLLLVTPTYDPSRLFSCILTISWSS